MDVPSTSSLSDRIDAALVRIDAALAARAPLADLQRRHEALREAAALSLQVIDTLIAAQEGAQAADVASATAST